MDLSLNERYIKLGKFPITETIPVDGAFQIRVGEEIYYFQCVKVEKKSNQDGTYDEVYICKHTHS